MLVLFLRFDDTMSTRAEQNRTKLNQTEKQNKMGNNPFEIGSWIL